MWVILGLVVLFALLGVGNWLIGRHQRPDGLKAPVPGTNPGRDGIDLHHASPEEFWQIHKIDRRLK